MTTIENTRIDKSLDDIRQDLYTNISQFQTSGNLPKKLSLFDGVLRGMVELTAWGLYQLYGYLKFKLLQAFPHLSTGVDLLQHCESVGLVPKPASKTEGVLKVTRIDTVGVKTIPVGKIFKTRKDSQGQEYRYISTEEHICQDGEAHAFPKVEAESPGRAYNVSVGSITEIVTPVSGFDSVTNESDWITAEGHDEESEDSLKTRYILQWKAVSETNDAYYEKIARDIDGVVDVFIDDQHPRGQATVDIIIRGENGAPPGSVITNVQAAIDTNSRQFDDVRAFPITVVNQPLELHLYLTSGDMENIIAEVRERLFALNDPLTTKEGVAPLQIRQNLTLDTLIVAAKLREVNKIDWISPTVDVVAGNMELINISSVTITAEFV